jgi:hypothetical protein
MNSVALFASKGGICNGGHMHRRGLSGMVNGFVLVVTTCIHKTHIIIIIITQTHIQQQQKQQIKYEALMASMR